MKIILLTFINARVTSTTMYQRREQEATEHGGIRLGRLYSGFVLRGVFSVFAYLQPFLCGTVSNHLEYAPHNLHFQPMR